MPVLERDITGRPERDFHGGVVSEVGTATYFLLVPSGAAPGWLGPSASQRERHSGLRHRPQTMLQPVTFDDTPDDRLRVVRLHPVDESEDHW